MELIKKAIVEELRKHVSLDANSEIELTSPPDPKMGDFAFPCFALAKKEGKNPAEIAKELCEKLSKVEGVKEIKTLGPYLNFFLDKTYVAKIILPEIMGGKYGAQEAKKEKVMIEYSQANTHKAFHVGHLRGTSLGESLSRILKYVGYTVVQANYQGDTGAHVAKWIWCYLKFHKGEQPPEKNPEEWIANIYVEGVKKTNEDTQKEIDEVNKKLEEGTDKEMMDLWKKSRQWSLDSLELIYKDLNAHFDEYFFEGMLEGRAREVSKELVERGIAEIDEGAIIGNLEEHKLGIWVLLRKDGTCLYSSKDLALAERKFNEYKIDKSLYVVGAAQSMHLKQVFKTLELMKFPQAKDCFHLAYNEVRLPTGKMSSRTGVNILYTQLKEEMLAAISKEVSDRHSDWSEEEKKKAVWNIFSAAIKFDMLVQDPNKPIVFDITKAMDFQGETGPYVQYAIVRINSILGQAGGEVPIDGFKELSSEKEEQLVMTLAKFPSVVNSAAEHYRPPTIARYALELAKHFNEFYHDCPILKAEGDVKESRLVLISGVKEVLSTCLDLLGINVAERM